MNENEDIDSIEAESITESSGPIETINFDQPAEVIQGEQPATSSDFGQQIEVKNFSQTSAENLPVQNDKAEELAPTEEQSTTKEPTPTLFESMEAEKPVGEPVVKSSVEEVKVKKISKWHIIKKILLFLLIIVLMAAAAFGAYWWRDKDAKSSEKTQASEISSLKSDLALTNIKLSNALIENEALSNQSAACTEVAPALGVLESIKSSITSSNLSALLGYMNSSVALALADKSSSEVVTAAQALSDISAFTADATLPWNFSVIASTLNTYKQGSFGKYFVSTSTVGKSANNKVVSISYDCSGKIDTIFMSSKESLLE